MGWSHGSRQIGSNCPVPNCPGAQLSRGQLSRARLSLGPSVRNPIVQDPNICLYYYHLIPQEKDRRNLCFTRKPYILKAEVGETWSPQYFRIYRKKLSNCVKLAKSYLNLAIFPISECKPVTWKKREKFATLRYHVNYLSNTIHCIQPLLFKDIAKQISSSTVYTNTPLCLWKLLILYHILVFGSL